MDHCSAVQVSQVGGVRVPESGRSFNPKTGFYGFRVWFEDRRPHYAAERLGWLDSHREYAWEETSSLDALVLAVARRFREGSVAARMLEWPDRRDPAVNVVRFAVPAA